MMTSNKRMKQVCRLLLLLAVLGLFSCAHDGNKEPTGQQTTTVNANHEHVSDACETVTDSPPSEKDSETETLSQESTPCTTPHESEAAKDPNQGEWDPQN